MAVKVPKPAVLESVPTDASSVVEASAGTGKTYTLEHLIVELVVEEELAISNILVVTFTDRATAELTERVRGILQRLVRRREGGDVGPDEPHWTIDEAARRRLREALFSFDRAPIYTIHGFCHRVLVEHAFANRRPFEQELVEFDDVFEEAFHGALRTDLSTDPGRELLLEAHLDGSTVDDLESTLAQAVATTDRVEPTCERAELEAVLEAIRPTVETMAAALREAHVEGTLHGARESKVLRYLDAFDAGFEARDRSGPFAFPFAFEAELKSGDEHPAAYIPDKTYLTKASEDLYDPAWTEAMERLREVPLDGIAPVLSEFVPLVRDRFERLKAEEGAFTYDDMLGYVRDAVVDGGDLVDALREEYAFALVDEFQDTDPVQWEIFRKVFYESGASNPCVLVGDPKQAIYGFRGADVRTYFEAADEVGEGDDGPIRLAENYRSTPELVDAYNRILDPDADEPFFREPNAYPSEVESARDEMACVDADGRDVDPIVVTQIRSGDEDSFSADGYRHALARRWARHIRDLLADDRAPRLRVWDDEAEAVRPVEANDIFVLTRKRGGGDLVAEHLRAVGVPHAFYKRGGLFETPEARDWYELLRAVDRPGDRSRRLKAWTTPFFEVDLADVADADEVVDENHPLVATLNRWSRLGETGRIGQLVHRALDESGLIQRQVFERYGQRELTNYEHLAETFVDWAQSDNLALGDIVTRLGRYVDGEAEPQGHEGDLQRLESERESVQLMTMHKAKGLSAPLVFLFGGYAWRNEGPYRFYDDGERVLYFGSKGGHGDAVEAYRQEEAERLLYVAMTRPESRLYLPYAAPVDRGRALSRGSSPMGPLFERLDGLLERGEEAPTGFRIEERVADPTPPGERGGAETEDARENEEVARALAEVDVPTTDGIDVDYGGLRAQRRLFVESYSSVDRWERSAEREFADTDALELNERSEAEEETGVDEAEVEGPPPGRQTGLCVHALLEELDWATAADASSIEDWRDDDRVDEQVASLVRHYGLETHRGGVERLVWRSLRSPVAFGDLELAEMAAVAKRTPELEFWYPIPGETAPTLETLVEEPRPERSSREDGYLRGFIDLVFEWEGRVYAADWKTNWLGGDEAYRPEAIAEVVGERYEIQLVFYATALARLLARRVDGVEEFEARLGGVAYLFVRGLGRGASEGQEQEAASGVFFERPDFETLLEWEAWTGRLVAGKLEEQRAGIAEGAHDRWA